MLESEQIEVEKARIAQKQGQLPLAIGLCQEILKKNPRSGAAYQLFGKILFQTGNIGRSEQCFYKAIELLPGNPDPISDLADFFRLTNRFQKSIDLCHSILQSHPEHLNSLNNLGATLVDSGRSQEAVAPLRKAQSLQQDNPVILFNLARALMEADQHEESIEPLRKILSIKPDFPQVRTRLLDSLVRAKRSVEAQAFYPEVVASAPNAAAGWASVGHITYRAGYLTIAVQAFQQALKLNPTESSCIACLADSFIVMGQYTDAETVLKQALRHQPQQQGMHSINLATLLALQGRNDEAIALYQEIFEELKQKSGAHSNYVLHSQYIPNITPQRLLEIHTEWNQYHGLPQAKYSRPHLNTPDPDRRIRLGFVSGDLESGPVGSLTYRCISALDPEQFAVYIYSGTTLPDDRTARFKRVGQWRVVGELDDQRLDDIIRTDQIDILVDLSGHVGNNRLPLFARKPAPVQITWLGYEGTTGLTTMDYLIADPYMIEPNEEQYYVEKILRIEEGYLCYQPHDEAPELMEIPSLKNEFITLGSFSNPNKFNHDLFVCWAKLLNHIPGSKLMLKYRGMNDLRMQSSIRQRFSQAGGNPDRLIFSGWTSVRELMETYRQIDIALDTFSFTGSATTCDALWMGVPVITMKGQTFAGRHGYGHLSRLGLTELIAHDLDEYIRITVELANDPARRIWLHDNLRQMMAERLCNGHAWARSFSRIIRQVWQNWCHDKIR